MPDIGQLFSPFAQGQDQQGAGNQDLTTPAQEVIKLLSLRFPRYFGASAPAPQGLLGGKTAIGGLLNSGIAQTQLGHSIGDSVAEKYLQSLFSGQMAPDMGGGQQDVTSAGLPISFDFNQDPNAKDVYQPGPPTPSAPQAPNTGPTGNLDLRRRA